MRGVRYAPRGRDGWARTGGGVWPLEMGEASAGEGGEEDLAALAEQESVVESDKPLARALAAARAAMGMRQTVLGLPLSQLLVRVLRMPLEVRDDLLDAVTLQMDKLSPFPGEELAVGCEILSEDESHLWVFAAALPAAIYDDLGAALNAAGLQVCRTDVSTLGWLRSLGAPCGLMGPGRRMVLMNPDGGWDLLVLDDGTPLLMRSLGSHATPREITRDLMLSLMSVEQEAGARELAEVVVVSREAPSPALAEQLSELADASLRHVVPPTEDGGVEGLALRAGEGSMLDLTPQVWRDEIREARFRKRLFTGAGFAAAVWALFMGVLFAGPLVYKQLTARERNVSKAHYKAYRSVADTRDRVRLIESYTDRSRSPLEMLRMTALYLPEGVTLLGFTFKRDDGVRISGEADQPTQVYDFKDAVTAEPLFDAVTLIGPALAKGRHKFDVDAKFPETEDQR